MLNILRIDILVLIRFNEMKCKRQSQIRFYIHKKACVTKEVTPERDRFYFVILLNLYDSRVLITALIWVIGI